MGEEKNLYCYKKNVEHIIQSILFAIKQETLQYVYTHVCQYFLEPYYIVVQHIALLLHP